MKISVTRLRAAAAPCPLTIHSLDGALYHVTVAWEGAQRVLVDDDHRPLRYRSLQAAREALRGLPVASVTLSQRSAYDEMIGQPPREGSNALALPLAVMAAADPPEA